jgi:hypothetical protein
MEKKIINKMLEMIKKSIFSHEGKESSTRIASYVILLLIFLFTVVFLGIEIYSAIQGKLPSNEAIIIFGMLMTHQLTLLGITKYHESKNKIEK